MRKGAPVLNGPDGLVDFILAKHGVMLAITTIPFRVVLIELFQDGQGFFGPDLTQGPYGQVSPVVV